MFWTKNRIPRKQVPSSTQVNFSALGLNAGDPFNVPAGLTIVLDVDTPSLGAIDISGTLRDDGNARTLTATQIVIESGGALQVGTQVAPYAGSLFTISLTGAYVPLTNTTINGFTTPTNPGNSRGIMVMPGGTLDLHGTPPSVLYTQLNANAAAGATSLTLSSSPSWPTGTPVVVAPSDFVDYQGVELFTLNGATSGTSATLSAGLAKARWGQLQYPTDTGLSLSPGTFSTLKASANVPTVLDERPRIANLARNVVVSCPSDSDWSTKGHGVVIMAMATNGLNQSVMRLESVQIRRGGQRSAIGRYPIHWHMMSYNASTGAFTSDATGYARKCVVWDSENRAYTIHGTCGVELSDNISYNAKGHNYFLEDGPERRNTIQRNMAFKSVQPNAEQAMPGSITSISGNGTTTTVNWTGHGLYSGQVISPAGWSGGTGSFNGYRVPATVINANQFTYLSTGNGTPTGGSITFGNDIIKVFDGQSAGFWLANLDNTIEFNYACGNASGHGAWIGIASHCFGLSNLVACAPDELQTLSLKGFICHSNFGQGILHSRPQVDEAGNAVTGNKYPQTPGSGDLSFGDPKASSGTFSSTDHILYKNSSGAYFNNTNVPSYQRWTVADNGSGAEWRGSTNNGGTSFDHLGCSYSLNSSTGGYASGHDREVNDLDGNFGFYPRASFTSYHGTVAFTTCSWFNYVYHAIAYQTTGDNGRGGGMIEGGVDFYDVAGVDRTNGLNSGNKLFNTHPGPMCPTPGIDNRGVDTTGAMRHWSIAQVWLDIDGKYGTAGKYMLSISPAAGGVVDDFYLSGATNLADGPTSGTVVCKTTDTKFHGIGSADTGNIYLKYSATPLNGNIPNGADISRLNPLTVARQDPVTGAAIGNGYQCKRADTSSRFNGYHTADLQNAGRFSIDFGEDNIGITMTIASPCVVTYNNSAPHGMSGGEAITFATTGALPTGITAGTTYFVLPTGITASTFRIAATAGGAAINTSGSQSGTQTYKYYMDAPDSMVGFDVITPGTAAQGDYLLLGVPWNGGTPRIFVGNNLSNELDSAWSSSLGSVQTRHTAASAADISGGKAYQATTSVASIAAVLADTTGQSYFNDTANKRCWIRWTNRNNAGSGALPAVGAVFGVQLYQVVIKV